MATNVTVGMDPFDCVIRVNFDDETTGRRAQAEMDEKSAENASAAFRTGGCFIEFRDTISGAPVSFPVQERNTEIAGWLKAAASDLRAHKAGEVDLRTGLGKVPKA